MVIDLESFRSTFTYRVSIWSLRVAISLTLLTLVSNLPNNEAYS